jgi:hypothetical protein
VHVLRPFFLIWRSPPAVILDDKNQHMRFCQGLKDLLRQGTPGSHRLAHANLMRNGKKPILIEDGGHAQRMLACAPCISRAILFCCPPPHLQDHNV